MPKDDAAVEACGDVDEAQAAIGVVRSLVEPGSELDSLLIGLARDLWVLMAELATPAAHRDRLVPGKTSVSPEMVAGLEPVIDDVTGRFDMPEEFVVPGQSVVAAHLDSARTVVRRAERHALAVAAHGSSVVPYLNRLSDLLWTLARWQEGVSLPTRPDRSTTGEESP